MSTAKKRIEDAFKVPPITNQMEEYAQKYMNWMFDSYAYWRYENGSKTLDQLYKEFKKEINEQRT